MTTANRVDRAKVATRATADNETSLTRPTTWCLRIAGANAAVNGLGFGAYALPAAWHLAHGSTPEEALGSSYDSSPFATHDFTMTAPVLVAFLVSCLLLALGGCLLIVPQTVGVVLTLAGLVMCAPFWWGFDLPFAWFNAATVLVLLALAWAVQASHLT